MLIFNEGVPGSGKTYDAVLTHLLGALKAGRQVFARINGLQPDKIADYLNQPLADIQALLHQLTDADIPNLATIVERDSLVLIDEAHTYYVAGRVPLSPAVEQFFAEHRHMGLDIILMSQWYKRMHAAIRARVERKYVFQKLSAIGLKGRYTVRQMASIAPDKFEQVDIQTRKYNDAIFPLYQSVQPGTGNTDTYSVGATTAWRKPLMYAVVMVPLGIAALFYVARFFTGDVGLVNVPGVTATKTGQPSTLPPKPVATAIPQAKPKGYDTADMPPTVAYLFEVAGRARPRLAGMMTYEEGSISGIVEFHEAAGTPIERLTFRQIKAMGAKLAVTDFGVVITYGKQSIVATNWPTVAPASPPPNFERSEERVMQRTGVATSSDAKATTWPASKMPSAYIPPAAAR